MNLDEGDRAACSTETPTDRPVRVVFVVGSGRCGTTLLDAMLGNHPLLYGAGELALLSAEDYFDRFYCPCGKPVNSCPFWNAVVASWFRRTGLRSLLEHARIRSVFEGPRLHGLSRLMRERLFCSRRFQEYSRQTTELYRAIAEVSGKEVVVDSSVIPMRALALSLMPGIDLRLIHIVRDCRGVAWSLKKGLQEDPKAGVCTSETPRPAWRSSLTWMSYNIVASWVCRMLPPGNSLFCRYEDLVTNPSQELSRIGALLGCDFTNLIADKSDGVSFQVGCTFGGNRLRMNKSIRLQLDTDWVQKLTIEEQQTIVRLCGWLMKQYGYCMVDQLT